MHQGGADGKPCPCILLGAWRDRDAEGRVAELMWVLGSEDWHSLCPRRFSLRNSGQLQANTTLGWGNEHLQRGPLLGGPGLGWKEP